MTVKELLKLTAKEVQEMTPSQMRKAIKALGGAVRKRAQRLRKKDYYTPAMRRLQESGGPISSQGLANDELLGEFMRAKSYLNEQTSSITGYENVLKQTQKEFAEKGVEISIEQVKELSSLYEELKDSSKEIAEKGFRYWARGAFADVITDKKSIEEAILEMQEMLEGDYDGVSEFFAEEEDI